ncbi:MAG: hypothetical protein AB1665_00465 [Candidatus Thermoplasmatota archaeon]
MPSDKKPIEITPYKKSFKERLASFIARNGIISRTDITQNEIELTKLPKEIKAKLKEMQPYLDSKTLGALRVALCIKYLDQTNPKKAQKMYEDFIEGFGYPLTKLYNIVSSPLPAGLPGNIDGFDYLYAYFREIIKEDKSREAGVQFQAFVNSILRFCPYAIWVINKTTIEEILIDVRERFIRRVPEVAIFALKDNNVSKVLDACERIKTISHDEYDIKIEFYNRRRRNALHALIRKKERQKPE